MYKKKNEAKKENSVEIINESKSKKIPGHRYIGTCDVTDMPTISKDEIYAGDDDYMIPYKKEIEKKLKEMGLPINEDIKGVKDILKINKVENINEDIEDKDTFDERFDKEFDKYTSTPLSINEFNKIFEEMINFE